MNGLGRFPLSSYDLLKLVEAQGLVGTWAWDLNSGELKWSPGIYHVLGLDPSAVSPSYDLFTELVHPEDRTLITPPARGLGAGGMIDCMVRIIRPDGLLRWIVARGEMLCDRDGEPTHLVLVLLDRTMHQKSKIAFDHYTGSVRALESLLGAQLWHAARDGSVQNLLELRHPSAGANLCPRTPQGIPAAIHPDDVEAYRLGWERAIAEGRFYEGRYRVLDADGRYRRVRARAIALKDGSGRLYSWVGASVLDDQSDSTKDEGSRVDALRGAQVRAGRSFLGWSARDLATRAGVSVSTVRRLEDNGGQAIRREMLSQICLALFEAGIAFGQDGTGGLTIRYFAEDA